MKALRSFGVTLVFFIPAILSNTPIRFRTMLGRMVSGAAAIAPNVMEMLNASSGSTSGSLASSL